jgi:CRP-like cAMP-binding protein
MATPRHTDHASPTGRPKNKLLADLSPDDFKRLAPHLDTVRVQAKQILQRRHESIEYVYFLNGGVASITAVMQDGGMVEVATVGDEGVVGMDLFYGNGWAAGETMMQVPDTDAERMAAAAFSQQTDRNGALYQCVRRYSEGLIALMMQSSACLARHHVHERCARWLLMAHDRVHRDEFHLSHEFLAMMLGSTRPTVSIVASTLQKAGFIQYMHGKVTIVDRPGLEAASCECYATVRQEFDRLGL